MGKKINNKIRYPLEAEPRGYVSGAMGQEVQLVLACLLKSELFEFIDACCFLVNVILFKLSFFLLITKLYSDRFIYATILNSLRLTKFCFIS